MKILHVITLSELGGAQTLVVNLANNFTDEIYVAAGDGDDKLFQLLSSSVKKIKLKHLGRRLSVFRDIFAFFELLHLRLSVNPDVVHLHSSKAGILGRLVFPKKKIIYTVHGFDSIRLANPKFLPLEKVFQYFCRFIVAVSEYDAKNLRLSGITNNVRCIKNGLIDPIKQSSSLMSKEQNRKKVLCIARDAYPKRLDIFKEIAIRLPQFDFFWIGANSSHNNLTTNTYFLGKLPNAFTYCSDAELIILPSDYEGLPMVIIEALSYGKPVVASKVGGISEIVIDGINGFTVKNDVEDFVQKILMVLEGGLYASYCKNSRKIYENELTIDRVLDEYRTLYKLIYSECR